MKRFKQQVYEYLRRHLARNTIRQIGRSAILRPLRDLFFRPGGKTQIFGEEISFESYRFYFSASYQVFSHAKVSGIEARICRLLMSQLRPGDLAIDVGASYGFITLMMGMSVAPTGRVFSFEPVAQIFDTLKSNIDRNHLAEVCSLYPQAVGATNENGFIALDELADQGILEQVRAIKIDVDGGDYEVLRGAENLLRRDHPLLIVEMVEKQEQIFDFARHLGYTYLLDMDADPVVPKTWPPNLIASMTPVSIPARGTLKR